MSDTSTAINIRQAHAEDARSIASLAAQLYIELDLENYENAEEEIICRITAELLTQNRIVGFLAEDQGQAVGLITLHCCAAIYAGGQFGEISELYVSKDHRGQRVGQNLLDVALRYAEKQGWKRLELGAPTGSRWDNTYSFYQDCGFVAIGPRLRLLIPQALLSDV